MQYAVHLYPTVRVKVTGIEADSATEAITKAEASVNLHDVLDNQKPTVGNIEAVEWDEGENNFALVDTLDEKGQVICKESQWFDGEGNLLVDHKTPVERRAAAASDATLFMQELLDSVETLAGIADEHGARTLADLMYLQAAIIGGGFIDHHFPASAVTELASSLPSGERWVTFIKKDYMAQPSTAGA